jgi:hypothetical protein
MSAHVVVVAAYSVPTLAAAFKVVEAERRHTCIKFGNNVTTEVFAKFGEAVAGNSYTEPGKVVLLFELFNGLVDGCLECQGFADAEVNGVVCILGLQFSLNLVDMGGLFFMDRLESCSKGGDGLGASVVEEAHSVKGLEVVRVEFVHGGVQVGVGDSGEFGEMVADTCGDDLEGGMSVGAGDVEVDEVLVGFHVDLKVELVFLQVHAHI